MDVVERTSHEIRVEADERDIHDFNDQWPASNLHGLEGVTFTFDARNGDLIGLDYANGSDEEWDGPALLALSEDAQTAAGLSASHSPNRGHGQGDFAGGFAAAKADRAAGRTRQLCQSEHGVKPPVTKREDGTEYYHGYKAAAGGAQNELSAYMQYRATHRRTSGMQTNPTWGPHAGDDLTMADVRRRLGTEFVDRFLKAENAAILADSRAHGAWMANEPEDHETYRALARLIRAGEHAPNGYDSWRGPGHYGMTAAEVDRAARVIANSDELFSEWTAAYKGGPAAEAEKLAADTSGCPRRNIDSGALDEVDREIARHRMQRNPHLTLDGNFSFGIGDKEHTMRTNAGRRIFTVSVNGIPDNVAGEFDSLQEAKAAWRFVGRPRDSWVTESVRDSDGTYRTVRTIPLSKSDDEYVPGSYNPRSIGMEENGRRKAESIGEGYPLVRIYDAGPDSGMDRYTAVIVDREWQAAMRPGDVPYLGFGPGIDQFGEGPEGPGLGRRIAFADLPENMQAVVRRRLRPETMKANARQNITAVIDAFRAGRAKREATCSTDGDTLYSYGLPIASRRGGEVEVLDISESPSRTTSSQIRAVAAAFPAARRVASVMHESAYGSTGAHRANGLDQRQYPKIDLVENTVGKEEDTDYYTQRIWDAIYDEAGVDAATFRRALSKVVAEGYYGPGTEEDEDEDLPMVEALRIVEAGMGASVDDIEYTDYRYPFEESEPEEGEDSGYALPNRTVEGSAILDDIFSEIIRIYGSRHGRLR